jgi:capsular polysaccharide biosynthesis protein
MSATSSPVVPETADATPVVPLIDLSRLAAGIRWRSRTWKVLAAVGLLLGLLAAPLLASGTTATTRVYVVHADESGTASDLMKTDIAVTETSSVAERALRALGTGESPEAFMKTYTAASDAGGILDLTVRGKSAPDAVARAQALADAFIADHVARSQAASLAKADALHDQQRDLQTQLDRLATPPAQDAGGTAGVAQQRQSLQGQIAELDQSAQQVSIGSPEVAAGTRIIDAPHAAGRGLVSSLVLGGGIGLLLGLVIGLAFATIASIVADRPVLRRDIAAHLGASVIAQVPRPRRRPFRRGRASREALRRVVVGQLVRTVDGAPRGVSLLSLGAPAVTVELARAMAVELSGRLPVTLVDDLGPGRRIPAAVEHDGVEVVDGTTFAALPADSGRAQLGIGSVEPGVAWTDLPRLGTETILVVHAGHSDTAWLHTVARQLADLDVLVIGVVVVHPDPRDRTDGTLWDALHLALRGRRERSGGAGPEQAPGVDAVVHVPVVDGAVAPSGQEPSRPAVEVGPEPTVATRPGSLFEPALGPKVWSFGASASEPAVATLERTEAKVWSITVPASETEVGPVEASGSSIVDAPSGEVRVGTSKAEPPVAEDTGEPDVDSPTVRLPAVVSATAASGPGAAGRTRRNEAAGVSDEPLEAAAAENAVAETAALDRVSPRKRTRRVKWSQRSPRSGSTDNEESS